ncbi:hypothetical protein I6F07_05500 [Ensifer sp. IC4062]|nr:hypothetical protein [Ensifer sp. IC4062]MCA1439688.1 hypothetical protein [Ensifer sp. IC4062]
MKDDQPQTVDTQNNIAASSPLLALVFWKTVAPMRQLFPPARAHLIFVHMSGADAAGLDLIRPGVMGVSRLAGQSVSMPRKCSSGPVHLGQLLFGFL